MHLLTFFPHVMQNVDGGQISITISSASLQPFTDQQWRINQEQIINTVTTYILGSSFLIKHKI